MNLKLIKMRVQAKKSLAKFWYWLMTPLAYFYSTKKENARYEKKLAKITRELAIQYIGEDIAEYIVKRSARYKGKHQAVSFVIADYVSEEDYNSIRHLPRSMMRRKKTQMAYYKFNRDVEFQEAILDKLCSFKGIVIKEVVEVFTWQRIDNYQKTVYISYEG